jgi:DNA mismatch repair protein MutS
MQVGSFHEAYCTNDKGLNLVELAQKLDVVCTKKNGSKELNDSNPRMMGFPTHVTQTFIEKLINMNYTVVLIDQTTEPPNPKREITAIYSPATYLEKNTNKTKNIVAIIIDKIKTKLNDQLCIGLASYNLATGEGYFYETYSTNNDELLALDDTLRFLDTVPASEILLVNNITDSIANMKPTDIIQYLQLNEKNVFNIKIDKHDKIKYQERILSQVFPSNNQLSVFENLDLVVYNYARLALVILLEYSLLHQNNLLNNIKKPTNFTSNKFLYLGNRALDQLDVFTKNSNEKGLFNIINYTKTSMGQRYLYNSLSKPLIKKKDISIRYDSIEKLIENEHYNKIISFIEDIYDIEKLNRRINMGTLHPYELNQVYLSFYQINKLVEYIKTNELNILNENNDKDIKFFIEYIDSRFITSELDGRNFNNYYEDTKTFYKKGIYKNIDELVDKIESGSNFITLLQKKLESLISDDKSLFGKSDNSLINTKFNERDGHYMLITNRRCKILKSELARDNYLMVGSYKLKVSDLEFSELPKSSNTKINCDKIKEISNELVINKQKLAELNKSTFKTELEKIINNFNNLINFWGNEIGYIDFINSGAICAIKNKYTKPIAIKSDVSFFNAVNLRHPIVEIINKEYNYVPHSIGLGEINDKTKEKYNINNELDGILLYGINSSGKSTLMKSIGLNIILAQIGYYVAGEKFIFSPYNSLFTRIIGNDNMYKGLSSFMVEMMELTAILKRNNNTTLVIGDEICKGTEEKSATIVSSYMLEKLSTSKSSFITATHLHKIATMNCIQKLERVKSKHLKITEDPSNEQLIYDRELSDGQGDSFYGLLVAKFLMKDSHFNMRTAEILKEYDEVYSFKKSNYNDDYMVECQICKSTKNLESHHIIPQKDFDKNEIHKTKIHIIKNNYSNIVTLCDECHDKIDTSEIIINGWKETTNGKVLDYELKEKTTIIKHSDELINYIKELKKLNDPKMALIKIKEKFNKKVSIKTVEKYWN